MTDRPVNRYRSLKTAGLVGSMLISALGLFAYISAQPATANTGHWLPVATAPLVQRIGMVGRIAPGSLLTLSAPFDGTVAEKNVVEGQRVERGQVLLRLDTTLLQIQLRDALAEQLKARRAVQDLQHWAHGQDMARARRAVSTSQLSLDDTERKLKETRVLLDRGIVPRMEVDALTQQAQTQRLDLKAAHAELKDVSAKALGENRQIADMQLANASAKYQALLALEAQRDVSAPFAGIIVRVPGNDAETNARPVQQGARVSPGQPLFALANLERLQVVAKVDEGDINQLREGQPVDIVGDGFAGILLNGTITSVGSQVLQSELQGSGASYELAVALPPLNAPQQQRIRLGMSARLSIITYQNPSAIVVPPDALSEDNGQHFVNYRRTPEKQTRRVDVSIGQATSDGVEVFGLFPGFIRTDSHY
ncbi:HlyD family efflux transporter periplasmic adaptor subunit [Pseudomonas sp. 10B1]|uniref:efflux RND transporter periplasmic adaptor subunit n=1 Tax=unclassified Pseudomonas TaxID=196821 RepID=UPI002AB32985|nr:MULTISPECIES: HlyD family efflux transporter periplasmic adaptor subunit [unclassified Pseudomonas]MDY7561503.1 HlyD family efflux transporter periplasmic adaptor subunit [Pseudomonas sp. AB6]MEA9976720.1 HlyD family efflux transporter periplasmic adaptor subunit [Pseudomonas sp. RTS4]MEA9994943.1 HlyD family efflux transporter periplasmic adaptor subunit [Pseudomonas sp. AA4]MEB0088300.1 HlyD family efflux transporter periplasmic adaptor subunit [Pseudomonas sp. RTI1]MEB0127111.1 HlyD fami